MRHVLAALAVISTLVAAMPAAQAHGGGCRKSSPPGECCHMNRKTGQVHCHR
ncbi:hypothetical protein [Oricola thermophila]|uniref:YHYH domain-containing protein n=1 Tax=Oricola thermophila TaxID=2742145 RepID=A0A6N1VB24_9HYPH|nr:hypothetical protein [Oricola thermophila]QKV18166.1 hypothetical protein HTY61_06715 [Oricola thermophila]